MVIFIELVNPTRKLRRSCQFVEAFYINIETVQRANLTIAIFRMLIYLALLVKNRTIWSFNSKVDFFILISLHHSLQLFPANHCGVAAETLNTERRILSVEPYIFWVNPHNTVLIVNWVVFNKNSSNACPSEVARECCRKDPKLIADVVLLTLGGQ